MKRFLLIIISLCVYSLQAQKVAIIGYKGLETTQDGVSILALENLTAGEIYYFTENEYNNTTNQFVDLNESVVRITVNSTIAKGSVIYFEEVTPSTSNTFSVSVTSGTGSVTVAHQAGSGAFSLGSLGEAIYIYTDTDADPSNGVTEIHSAFFPGSGLNATTGGPMSTTENPSPDYPNAIVIHNFPQFSFSNEPYFSNGVNRVEYNISLADRTNVNKIKLENSANYVFAGNNQSLSTTAFTNFNLVTVDPTITLTKNTSQLNENSSSNFTFTFTASTAPTSNLVINFDVNDGITSATAALGSDYSQTGAASMSNSSGTVTIASGTTSKTITINPTGDTTLEPDETLKISISNGTGYNAGSPSTQTVTIVNDDTLTVVPDVAITGTSHYTDNEDGVSSFSFVALKDLAGSSSYVFSSNPFDKNTLLFSNVSSYPSELKWTAASGGLNRGDVVVVKKTAPNTFLVTKNGVATDAGTVTKLSPSKKFYISQFEGFFRAHTDTDDNPYNGITAIHSQIFTYEATNGFGGNMPTSLDLSTLYLGSVLVDGFANTTPNRLEYNPTLRPSTTVDQANFENPSNWLYSEAAQDLSPISFNNIIISGGSVNPKATVTLSQNTIVEDTETATYTFSLDAVATANTTINFSVAGTAIFSSDYTVTGSNTFTASTGSIIIPNGLSTAQLTINPITDANLESTENILLTITSGTGYDGGSPSSASLAITNDDANNDNPLIAIIGINHESPTSMSLVAVADIPANSTFYFLRDFFNKETLSFQEANKYTLTTRNSCLPKGTVLTITGNANGPLTVNCNGTSGATDCGTATIEGSGHVFDFLDIGTRYHAFQDDDNDPTNGITQIHSVFHTGGTYPSLHTGGTLTSEENPKSVYTNAIVVDGFPTTPNPNRTEFDATKRATNVTSALLEDISNYVHGQTNSLLSETNFNTETFAIKYVNASATPGGDGLSWATAYNSLQDALSNTYVCLPNEIWVAKGTYKPDATNENTSFVIPVNASIYGGFNGTETLVTERDWNANPTILSGDLNSTNTANSGDSHTILQIDNNNVVIDGFIIEYGYADGSSTNGINGSGIYNTGTEVVFKNTIFRNLTAQGNGSDGNGGVFFNSGSITFNNCVFYNNTATNDGGVGYSESGELNLINCTISKNTADSGGGFALNTSNATVSNSIFHSNIANTNQDIAQLGSGVANISYSTFGVGLPTSATDSGNNYTFFDPTFEDPTNNNFIPKISSLTINTGNDSSNTESKDLLGNLRKTGTIDRGAYEYDSEITEWNGRKTTSWSNVNNWSNGIPFSTKTAIIRASASRELTINITGATAKDFVVENATNLTIDQTRSLTIGRNFVNDGSLTIKTTNIYNGSLIINGTYSGTGNVVYQRYVTSSTNSTDANGWHLVSSPVNGQSISSIKNDLATNSNKYALATYNNSLASNRYEYFTDNTGSNNIDAAGNFIQGKGYSLKRATAGFINFSGTPNTENVSISISDNSASSGNKWNLIGNPFTASIAINNFADFTNNFLLTNVTKLDPSRVAIYQWNAATATYNIYNQATSIARFIAPGQGFFVESVDGSETITITKEMLQHQTGNIFSKSESTIPEIKLVISDENTSKETQIKYFEGTTTGLDLGYDAGVFSGTSDTFNIFTHLVSDSKGVNFALQCLPNTDFETMVIPIGLNINSNKTVTISSEVVNIPTGINVYLEDKNTNTFTNLSDESYTFTTTSKMEGIGRFYLHTSGKSLSINDEITLNNVSIYQTSKENLRIVGVHSGKSKIILSDILGKEVFSNHFEAKGTNNIPLSNLKTGIYIVRLETQNGQLVKKIVLK